MSSLRRLLTHCADHADATEKSIISSTIPSIHIFWVDSNRVDGTNWPSNRKYVGHGRKYTNGVFAMYQSSLDPFATLGMHRDLWLTPSKIYFKENDGIWSQWSCRNPPLHCPYDTRRTLMWSRNAELKYLVRQRSEAAKWKCELDVTL